MSPPSSGLKIKPNKKRNIKQAANELDFFLCLFFELGNGGSKILIRNVRCHSLDYTESERTSAVERTWQGYNFRIFYEKPHSKSFGPERVITQLPPEYQSHGSPLN
jgi:hypothetical protein